VSRTDEINRLLMHARRGGVVGDWIVSSPAGRTRWNVWGPGYERVFTTRELEAFLLGVTVTAGEIASPPVEAEP
jgi:hypothetical protein